MPKVSIIVPNYNHAKYLIQRMDCIFRQTFNDFEIILLDDCSTDNSIEILSKYSKNQNVSHFIINEINSGSTFKQWRKGIDLAKGEYVWIAESDDYCDVKFLENAVNKLDFNSNIGLVYCQSWKVNESNTITDTWFNWTKDLDSELFKNNFTYNGICFIKEFLIHKNVIPNASAVVFRKEVYDNEGGVNYDLEYCGDWFLWLKIALASDIAFISDPFNYFRYHQNSVIYKAVHFAENNGIYVERYQMTMRKLFAYRLKHKKLNTVSILSKNNYYISQEYLLQVDWYSNNNKKLKSINAGINYFFLTKDIHYLKRIIKMVISLFLGRR